MAHDTSLIDEEERFQVRVAWLYYVEGLTQGAIAEHLSVTRLRVNRALGTARRLGIVNVSINSAFAPCLELEQAMAARYGLESVSITPSPADPDSVQIIVGAALGNYLSHLLKDGRIGLFGIAWGNTLNFATASIMPAKREGLEVVSVMGGLPKGSDVNSFEITTRMADRFSARRTYLTAPLYASSEESRDTIMAQDVFQEVLAKIRSVDALSLGAGDMSERSLLVRDGLPRDVSLDELIEAGAVGDVLGYFMDARGRLIDHRINRRVIGIMPRELEGIGEVILAAGGAHKVPILSAALGTGFFDVFITDEDTAAGILAHGGAPG